jgi:hypothetical protein
MKNIIISILLAIALPANASVTYVWQTVTQLPLAFDYGQPFRGSMTFDDNVAASGFAGNYTLEYTAAPYYYSYFGLERVSFAGLGRISAARPVKCADVEPFDEFEPAPDCDFFGDLLWGPMLGNININVSLGPRLSGYVRANDFEGDFTMRTESFKDLWTIEWFRSDDYSYECVPVGCTGVTGYWNRVPEPALWWFELLMLAGVFRLRKYL